MCRRCLQTWGDLSALRASTALTCNFLFFQIRSVTNPGCVLSKMCNRFMYARVWKCWVPWWGVLAMVGRRETQHQVTFRCGLSCEEVIHIPVQGWTALVIHNSYKYPVLTVLSTKYSLWSKPGEKPPSQYTGPFYTTWLVRWYSSMTSLCILKINMTSYTKSPKSFESLVFMHFYSTNRAFYGRHAIFITAEQNTRRMFLWCLGQMDIQAHPSLTT